MRGENKETQMQSSLDPRPIRPLCQWSSALIGGLSVFCINSQIIRAQQCLFSSLQSFPQSPPTIVPYCSVLPPLLYFHLGFLYLCYKLQYLCYSHPPSLPTSIPSSAVSLSLFQVIFLSDFIFCYVLFLLLSSCSLSVSFSLSVMIGCVLLCVCL